jgi:hypothetical protein
MALGVGRLFLQLISSWMSLQQGQTYFTRMRMYLMHLHLTLQQQRAVMFLEM